METTYIWIIAGAIVLLVGLILSKNFSGRFGKMSVDKREGKGNISIKNVKNNADIGINTSKDEGNIDIEDVDNSEIDINKDKFNKKKT